MSKFPLYQDWSEEEEEESDKQSEDSEQEEEEINCEVCGGDEGLARCSYCSSAFHFDCHEPPLRHEPRSNWRCMQCKSGVRIRKSKREPTRTRKSKFAEEHSNPPLPPQKKIVTTNVTVNDTIMYRTQSIVSSRQKKYIYNKSTCMW